MGFVKQNAAFTMDDGARLCLLPARGPTCVAREYSLCCVSTVLGPDVGNGDRMPTDSRLKKSLLV